MELVAINDSTEWTPRAGTVSLADRSAPKGGYKCGLTRNPDRRLWIGQRVYAAVFTSSSPQATERTVNAAIGSVVAEAVKCLSG